VATSARVVIADAFDPRGRPAKRPRRPPNTSWIQRG
jgi:hypothetical protein